MQVSTTSDRKAATAAYGTPHLIQSASTCRSSDTCGHKVATTATISCTDSTDISVHMSKPGPDAAAATQKAFLDYQLDSLRGKEVLGRLTVLDKVSNRRHGGMLLPVMCAFV